MRDSFSRALLAGIAGFMLFVLAVPAVQGQADLAGAAKREGSVVVYGSIESDVFDVIRKIFEGQYGIRVDYFRASSNGTMDRVLTESRAGKPLYDVVLTNRSPMLILKKAGVFGNYVSPSYERYPVPTRDSHRLLSPSYRQVVVSALYNTPLAQAAAEAHHVAISAKAPHPNAARLFVDVFTSRLGLLALAKAGEFVLVPGVYPPIKDADKLRIVLMDDLSEQDLKQFRDQIGTLFLKR